MCVLVQQREGGRLTQPERCHRDARFDPRLHRRSPFGKGGILIGEDASDQEVGQRGNVGAALGAGVEEELTTSTAANRSLMRSR